MGPGITIKYWQVLGGILLALAVFLAVLLYVHFRGPVGGVSPYQTVNDLGAEITVTAEHEVYPSEVMEVCVAVCNGSQRDMVVAWRGVWSLEVQVDGVWHTVRPVKLEARLTDHNDLVQAGEQALFLLSISEYYKTPLEPGTYRVVLPDCGTGGFFPQSGQARALAAEFEVE